MLVECSLDTARELFRDNLGAAKQYTISPASLQKMRELEAAKKLVVTAVPQLATVSGAQAQARAVVELTYVTDYHMGESGETPILRTREVGTILNVTPTLDSDGQTINLTVITEYCRVIKPIRRIEYILPLSRIKTYVECPEFVSHNITTSVVTKSGSTVMVAGNNPSDCESKDAQTMIAFWVITARVNTAK